jgi:hypothetical protein
MEMTKAADDELIQELESRGYVTDLLWCRQDVILNLRRINQDREDKFVGLDQDEQDEILDKINLEYYTRRINEDIINGIFNHQDLLRQV